MSEEGLTNPPSTSSTNLLLALPNELVVMVASYLDLASFLALASTSNKIKETLVSKYQWTNLLQKTKMNEKRLCKLEYRKRVPKKFPVFPNMEDLEKYLAKERKEWKALIEEGKAYMEREKRDMEEEVENLALFLKSVDDVDGSLLLTLLHTICERFPMTRVDLISLSCPCGVIHDVSLNGFALLERAETIVSGSQYEPLQKLVTYQVDPVLALQQKCKVKNVIIGHISIGSELEVLLKMLRRCESWSIVNAYFIGWEEEYGDKIIDFIHGLASETTGGKIGNLGLTDKMIAYCTLDQLENLWKITRVSMFVNCWRCKDYSYIWTNPYLNFPQEEGWTQEEEWKKVVSSIRDIHVNKQAHYSKCE